MALAIGVWLNDLVTENDAASTYVSTAASLAALDAFIAAIGTPAACAIGSPLGDSLAVQTGQAPEVNYAGFPDFDLMTGLAERGCVPAIYVPPSGTRARVWQNHADGEFDHYWDGWCTRYRSWIASPEMLGLSTTVIVRPGQEMNASHFEYGVLNSGNTVQGFKNGWRYIHDRIRVVNGCEDILLFWCPFNTRTPRSPTQVWPGLGTNPYCQLAGIDAYPHTTEAGEDPPAWADVKSLRLTISQWYDEIIALSSDVDFAVGESGISIGSPANGLYTDQQRRSWIDGTQAWGGTGAQGGMEWLASQARARLFMYYDISGWALHAQNSYPLLYSAMADAYAANDNPFPVTLPPVGAPAMPLSFAP